MLETEDLSERDVCCFDSSVSRLYTHSAWREGEGGKEWNKRRERKKGKTGERESFGRDLKLTGTTHLSLEVIDESSEVFHEEWPRVNEEHSVHHHHHKTVAAERKHIKWGLHIQ